MIGTVPPAPSPTSPGQFASTAIWRIIPYLIVTFVASLTIWLIAYLYTEIRWYYSLGFIEVWRKITLTRAALFFIFFAGVFIFITGNVILAIKLSPLHGAYRRGAHWAEWLRRVLDPVVIGIAVIIGIICGLIAGLYSLQYWEAAILFDHRDEWGRTDPYFELDLGYFMFELPIYLFVHKVLVIVTIITLILAAITHFIFGGLIPIPPALFSTVLVRMHLTALLLCLLALVYWGVEMEHHMLSFSEFGVVTGLGYTDAEASLIAYNITRWAALAAFVLLVTALWWPVVALLLIVVVGVTLIALVAVRIYPILFQFILVDPQELEREAPYLTDHLEFTRYGYGLDVVERQLLSGDAALPDDPTDTLANLRLWDPATLRIVMTEMQALRSYYDIGDVDADRYTIDGEQRPVMVAPRELDLTGVTRRWQPRHMVYTHGRGMVAAHPNAPDLPRLLAEDIPVTDFPALKEADERLYFAERMPGYALVNTDTRELTGPRDEGGFNARGYDGGGGIHMIKVLDRIAFAIRFLELRLAMSWLLRDDSRVLMHREVAERAGRAAPFIDIADDPYPAAVDGRIVWIADVYVVSDMMPYSRRIDRDTYEFLTEPRAQASLIPGLFPDAGRPLKGPINYIRGGIKAVIDGVDGSVEFYETGESDPLSEAWKRAFPDIIHPVDEASDALRAQFRYPEDLFALQAKVWGQYHVEDGSAFYINESVWRVPPDDSFIARRQERATPGEPKRDPDLRPVWIQTRFPGRDEAEFAVVHAFVPDKRNNLAGYLVGGSDGDRLGKLTAYKFPTTVTVLGPAQAQARMAQDPEVSAWTTLRMQSGSRVSRGDVLLVPAGDGIAYIQPLFVQADESEAPNLLLDPLSSLPELKKVVMLYGDRVIMRDTLEELIEAVRPMQGGPGVGGDCLPGYPPSYPVIHPLMPLIPDLQTKGAADGDDPHHHPSVSSPRCAGYGDPAKVGSP